MTPIVSVVIPTLGRPQMLARAVASVLNQTMGDFELIVVVDGPDPATSAYLATLSDPRVKPLHNLTNSGAGPARDKGVQVSTGRWIAFLDDDDEWLPTKLEKQLAGLGDTDKTISTTLTHVVSGYESFVQPQEPYAGKQPIDEWLFDRRSWFGRRRCWLQTSSLLMPRELFDRVRFGTARHEDWELPIRAIKQFGYRLTTVHEPLVIYRTGNSYAWRPSAMWIDTVKDVVTPRAYSGFCLTLATQDITSADRNQAFLMLLRQALRDGKPTARQLFAFGMIWIMPNHLRRKIRAVLSGERTSASTTSGSRQSA